MSYCVNCGVALEKSQEQCPLCGLEVQNPREPYDPSYPKPYSSRIANVQSRVERRYAAIIVSVLLLLACCVCVMADLVYAGEDGLTWSVYPVGALLLLWVLILFPMCFAGVHPAAYVMLDACALLLYLYAINEMHPEVDWFLSLAVPQVLLYGLLGLIDVLLWRTSRIRGLEKPGVVVASLGVALMGLEIMLDLFNDMEIHLDWSWFVIIPCMAIALILFIIERKQGIKDEIFRRLRV